MNKKIILKQRPVGEPKFEDFELIEENTREPGSNEVLIKTIYMSLDPYMRGRMNDAKSYAKAVEIGEEMEAVAVSQVVKSNSNKFKETSFSSCACKLRLSIISSNISPSKNSSNLCNVRLIL